MIVTDDKKDEAKFDGCHLLMSSLYSNFVCTMSMFHAGNKEIDNDGSWSGCTLENSQPQTGICYCPVN